MMAKHDIVETNKMQMEYDGSKIDVERTAATDLDNGRLVVREGNTYKYPKDNTATELFLVTTPEVLYTSAGLHEFYNPEGKKIRAVRVMIGDIFSTTAIAETEFAEDDKLTVNNEGKLVSDSLDEGAAQFKVVSKRFLGKELGVTVERIK